MRKRVQKELMEYEQTISMINDREELLKELRLIDAKDYKQGFMVSGVGAGMGTIISGFALEKLIEGLSNTNDINMGPLIILAGGIVLGSLGLNDLLTYKRQKYIDGEKIKIVSKQFKPENGPLKKTK